MAYEPLEKALRSFETCALVNNNLCRKLFSSLESPTTFDERFKVASVPFFIAGFSLLSCKFDNFTFKCYIKSFHINIILKRNKNHHPLTIPFEKSKTVSFAPSIVKHIVEPLLYGDFQ